MAEPMDTQFNTSSAAREKKIGSIGVFNENFVDSIGEIQINDYCLTTGSEYLLCF